MPRRTSARALAAGALSLLLLAAGACGDDGGEADDDATTTSTTETQDETTTTTETEDETTTTTGSAGGELSEQERLAIQEAMRELLLEVDEVGVPELVEGTYQDGDEPNPCGANTDEEAPYTAIAGRVAEAPELQIAFLEEIRLYDTVAEAADTFVLGVENLGCGTAEDGTTISEPVDVTDEVGGDTAVVIDAANAQVRSTIVIVHYADIIAAFQFVAGPDAVTDALPEPLDVAAAGMAKIIDEIG